MKIDTPGSKFKEVTSHGGAARATLEPNEKWGLGESRNGFLGFIESVENGGTSGGIDREVA